MVIDIQDGMATGSGRSIDGFNLHQALLRQEHLFERFGGHYHAVGCTMEAANVEILARELEGLAQEALGEEDLIPRIKIDGEIALDDLLPETVKDIMALSPFGTGNPEPVFYAHSLEVMESRIVGERHLKLKVRQGMRPMEAIGFGLSDRHPLDGKTIEMVFTPELNHWQGYERIQLRIVDLEVTSNP
jgi:single-stranded-DNA-specific exonuclease